MNADVSPHREVPRQRWEQRWHPLRRQWVVIAAHRNARPWSGQQLDEEQRGESLPRYDPQCYLCPGNKRVNGAVNPAYEDVYVFDNDHPCVSPEAPAISGAAVPPYVHAPATGISRVVCYHPRHDLRLAQLPLNNVTALLAAWQQQYRDLGDRPQVRHVLVFENNGETVGVSNPHPHCQIYATNFVFPTIAEEAVACAAYHGQTGRSLLGAMIDAEFADGQRLLDHNEHALSFVPYCARYAYETFISPRRAVPSIAHLRDSELADLAVVLKRALMRLDNLWQMAMPYVLALHQAPTDGREYPGFHFHIELHPPLRTPKLLKYLAGPEVGGGGFIADTWPEDKAAELQAVGAASHYLEAQAPDATGDDVPEVGCE